MNEISPYFAVEAKYLLSNNQFDEAIELCRKGLDAFPDYVSGYRLYIEILVKSGRYKESQTLYFGTLERFPFHSQILNLKYKLKKTDDSIYESGYLGFEKELISAQQTDLNLKDISDMMKEFSIDHKTNEVYEFDTSSEIIAEILIEQEQYEEAIKAYEALSRNNPERAPIFKEIIESLKKRL